MEIESDFVPFNNIYFLKFQEVKYYNTTKIIFMCKAKTKSWKSTNGFESLRKRKD